MGDNNSRIFQNLHDLYKHLGIPTALIDPETDFTIFNLNDALKDVLPYKSPSLRVNYFVFNFVKNGVGRYGVDEQRFELVPGTVYFTNPGHFRVYEWENTDEVYLITLSEAFLKENIHANIFEEFPFLLAETFPGRRLSPEVFAEFERIYLQIHREYLQRSPFRKRIIANLFVVLLLKIKEHFWLDYNPIYEGNRSSLIVKNFKLLLEKHYRQLGEGKATQVYRIQDYADAQTLHPNYLSNVIKAKTGKSIGTWMAEKTVAEAKSLLQNSNISIKEIAYRLGFTESAHFSNHFKKHTNISPVAYRNEHNQAQS